MSNRTKGSGWVDRTCESCGKSFLAERNLVNKNPCRYCSRACWGTARIGVTVNQKVSDIDEVIRLYTKELWPMSRIGDRYGVTLQAIYHILKKAGIKRRKPTGENLSSPDVIARKIARHTRGSDHPGYIDIPIEGIVDAYLGGQTLTTIARSYNVSVATIAVRLKTNGVVMRQAGFSRWQICSDGHRVQSGLELIVDEWLTSHSVPHLCQPRYPFNRRRRADFLANGIYIEVWGIKNRSGYDVRRMEKLTQCEEAGLMVISLYPDDIEDGSLHPLQVLI